MNASAGGLLPFPSVPRRLLLMETSIHLKPAVNFKPGGVRTGDLSVRTALACTVPPPNLIGARENIQVFNRKSRTMLRKIAKTTLFTTIGFALCAGTVSARQLRSEAQRVTCGGSCNINADCATGCVCTQNTPVTPDFVRHTLLELRLRRNSTRVKAGRGFVIAKKSPIMRETSKGSFSRSLPWISARDRVCFK